MTTISISRLKAKLSAVIRTVVRGRVVVVTDRGRPVARLVPLRPPPGELHDLVEAGLVRAGRGPLTATVFDRVRPEDPTGALRKAVLEEREAGY